MRSLFRSRSNNSNCSPRNLNANNDVLNTNVNNGGSFHIPESLYSKFSRLQHCLSSPRSGGTNKRPRGNNQEYAWEFHGDYQGIIAYLKELETVFNGDTSKYIPITHAEIIKDGEYIFKGSTNKQRFINTFNTEE